MHADCSSFSMAMFYYTSPKVRRRQGPPEYAQLFQEHSDPLSTTPCTSQLPVTAVPGDLKLSSSTCEHTPINRYTNTHTQVKTIGGVSRWMGQGPGGVRNTHSRLQPGMSLLYPYIPTEPTGTGFYTIFPSPATMNTEWNA